MDDMVIGKFIRQIRSISKDDADLRCNFIGIVRAVSEVTEGVPEKLKNGNYVILGGNTFKASRTIHFQDLHEAAHDLCELLQYLSHEKQEKVISLCA